MELFDDIKERFLDFIHENSKLTASIVGLFILLFVSAVFVIIIHSNKHTVERALLEETFKKGEDFFPPSQDSLTDDYYFSRITSENWSDSERDKWFTVPDEKNIKELGEANNRISNKILEAAP